MSTSGPPQKKHKPNAPPCNTPSSNDLPPIDPFTSRLVTSQHIRPYPYEKWTLVSQDGSDWKCFHDDWWQRDRCVISGRKSGDIIRIAQISVLTALVFDVGSKGAILVRAEYLELYRRLCESGGESVIDGALILGQPGIGKSFFIVYVLLRRLAAGKRVLFTTSLGLTFLFDHLGVWSQLKAAVTYFDLPEIDSDSSSDRPWSLIDANTESKAESSAMTCASVFAILASSPDPVRYKSWTTQKTVTQMIPNPWSIDELVTLLDIATGLAGLSAKALEPYRTWESVANLVLEVGPCPRDIIRYIQQGHASHTDAIQEDVKKIRDVDILTNLIRGAGSNMSAGPHSLVLVWRDTPPNDTPPIVAHDRAVVTFKTRPIRILLMRHLEFLRTHNAKELFSDAGIPESDTLAGWKFEAIGIDFTSGNNHDVKSAGFHRMDRIVSSNKYDYRFQHSAILEEPTIIEVATDARPRLRRSRRLEAVHAEAKKATPSDTITQLPIKRRIVTEYASLNSCPLEPRDYYIPKQSSNPFFDAFFLEETEAAVIIWVLQMTIAKEHGGAESGITILTNLHAKVQTKYGRKMVVFKYVLVVPTRGAAVQWNLPLAWKNVEGVVYAQYLDLLDYEDYGSLFVTNAV